MDSNCPRCKHMPHAHAKQRQGCLLCLGDTQLPVGLVVEYALRFNGFGQATSLDLGELRQKYALDIGTSVELTTYWSNEARSKP